MKALGKIGAFIAVLVLAGATANPGYAQDAEHGKTVFQGCAACHATDHTNRVGPGLEGIIGRKAGTVPGFRYSGRALRDWHDPSHGMRRNASFGGVSSERRPYHSIALASCRHWRR